MPPPLQFAAAAQVHAKLGEARFPIWFYFGSLNHMGWPRKRGWLRRYEYVDSAIADSVANTLLGIGETVGMAYPAHASALIADVYPGLRDTTILEEPALQEWEPFEPLGRRLLMDLLGSAEWAAVISGCFASAVWRGLRNPDDVEAYYETDYLPTMHAVHVMAQSRGVDLPLPAYFDSLEGISDQALQTVRGFELLYGRLPDPDLFLLESAGRLE